MHRSKARVVQTQSADRRTNWRIFFYLLWIAVSAGFTIYYVAVPSAVEANPPIDAASFAHCWWSGIVDAANDFNSWKGRALAAEELRKVHLVERLHLELSVQMLTDRVLEWQKVAEQWRVQCTAVEGKRKECEAKYNQATILAERAEERRLAAETALGSCKSDRHKFEGFLHTALHQFLNGAGL